MNNYNKPQPIILTPNKNPFSKPLKFKPNDIFVDNNINNTIVPNKPNTSLITKPIKKKKVKKKEINEYEKKYKPYKEKLSEIIDASDSFISNLNEEMLKIKNSRSFKNKHMVISEIQSNITKLLDTKLNSVKEMNKIVTDVNKLILSKEKIKGDTDSINNNQIIMDLYSSMINGKNGMDNNVSIISPTAYDNSNALPTNFISLNETSNNELNTGYDNYINNRTPAQLNMIMDSNPNIQTIVRYNPNTGNKMFDVVDITNGKSLPNFERPDSLFLENTKIDLVNWKATNSDIRSNYDVMVDETI